MPVFEAPGQTIGHRRVSPIRFALIGLLIFWAQGSVTPALAQQPATPSAAAHASLDLGTRNHPDVVIITPVEIDTPALARAIDDLEHYLKLMIGDHVTVARVAAGKSDQAAMNITNALPIYVGVDHGHLAGELTRRQIGEQGFVLDITANGIQALGVSDWGTVYAVYQLLERMGVRWLFPGTWGEVVPGPGPVSLTMGRLIDQPGFSIREIHQYASRAPTQYGDWARRSRQAVSGYTGHSGLILKYRKTHPEWFALVDGKRMNMDSHPKLCHSNPQMVKQAIADVLQQIKERKSSDAITDHQVPIAIARQVHVISISPTDGGGFCECDECQKMGSVSDRLQIFANTVGAAVAKEYPDYKVGYYGAYSQAQSPPTVEAGPNVIVFATTWQKSFFLPLDNLRNVPFRDKIAAFATKCPNMAIRDFDGMYGSWWGWGPMSLIPAHEADYPWYQAHGVQGFIAEAYDHWAAGGQSYYVTTRLWWNPHADVNAIKRDFVDKGFGAAAAPMWRYYERINHDQSALSEITLNAMRHDLEEARSLARRPDVIHRIDMLRLYLLLNDTLNKAQGGSASDEQLQLAVRLGQSLVGKNIIGKGMVNVLEKLYLNQTHATAESIEKLPVCDAREQQQVLAAIQLPTPTPGFAPWKTADDLKLQPLHPQPAAFDPSMTSWVRYGPMTMLIYAQAGQTVTLTHESGRRPAPITYELRSPQLNIIRQGSKAEDETLTFTAPQEGVYTMSIATPGTWVKLQVSAQHVVFRAANAQDRFHPFRSGVLYFYVPRGTKQFQIVARTFVREKYSLRVWGPGQDDKPLIDTPSIGDASFRAIDIEVPPQADGQVWRLQFKGDKKEMFLQGIPPFLASSPQRLLILQP